MFTFIKGHLVIFPLHLLFYPFLVCVWGGGGGGVTFCATKGEKDWLKAELHVALYYFVLLFLVVL